MTAPNDGGPAFPHSPFMCIKCHGLLDPTTSASGPTALGMSLRDYFAAAALSSMAVGEAAQNAIAAGAMDDEEAAGARKLGAFIARLAYIYADAMLAERMRASRPTHEPPLPTPPPPLEGAP